MTIVSTSYYATVVSYKWCMPAMFVLQIVTTESSYKVELQNGWDVSYRQFVRLSFSE